MNGNPPATGTGAWSFAPGGNPDLLPLTAFSNTTLFNSTFTGTAGQTYVLRWTISNGVCTPSTDDVQIRLYQPPTTSVSGGNQTICGTSTNLNGTLPVIGTGQWSFAPGGNPDGLGVISDVNSRTSLFTGTTGQSYILRWTISNGTCAASFSDATITFNQTPTVSNAGVDQNFCGTIVTLNGNPPATGTGAWSFAPGGNPDLLPLTAFSNTAIFNSTFTGTAGQTYILRWTISNGVCTPSSDDVQIRLYQAPTTSVSGGNQTICGTIANLNGTLPVIGTGQWSFAPGGNPDGLGVISDVNSRTSLFTGTTGQSYILRWTISNGTCAASFSDATITFNQTPTVSNAGVDQNFCGTMVTLAANAPATGTGAWSFAPGGNPDLLPLTAFSNTTLFNSTFTGTAGQTYILRWTISNGVCTPSSDDVQIRLYQAPTTSVSGGNQTICGTTANLNGTLPVIGTGQWSFAPGGNPDGLGVISDVNSRTSLFTGTTGQSYILRWTISNGTCAASFSDATITFNQTPTVSNAGVDQNFCGTMVTLAANAPATGTGAWSFAPGGNPDLLPLTAFSNTTLFNSTFTGTAGQTYILRWTISNGVCTPSTDDVQIRFYQPPTTSVSGGNQTICGTSANLNGTLPVIGTGQWSFAPGGNPDGLGVISDVNSRTSLFTGTTGQSYILRWTISNGTCAASFSDATITFNQTPTVSNAGVDQNFCGTMVTLAANAPATGTGAWSFAPGGNPDLLPLTAFSNTAIFNSTFTGTAGQTYILRWTISSGICTPSIDDVQVRLGQAPTVAAAGSDQTGVSAVCGTSTSLAGNVPVIGTGVWSIVSGGAGSFVNAASPTTVFNGVAGTTYELQWTISNGVCIASTDNVFIEFNQTPTVSAAGPDQNFCGTIVTLAANAPTIGTGAWSFVTNPDLLPLTAFSNTASPTSTFTGTAGQTYILRWTITNGICTASTDDVQIRLDQAPTVAAAGSDQTGVSAVCGTSTTLAGNVSVVGTGAWSIVSGGGGSFVNANSPTTVFNGVAGTTYELQWTIGNGVCAASTDNVFIEFNQTATVSAAGPDQNFCGTIVTLAANAPTIGTGAWSFVTNPDLLPLTAFSNTASPTSTFTGTAGLTYVLRWTISNGVCTASTDDVQIRLDQSPTPAAAGGDQTGMTAVCGTSTTLAANVSVIGTGAWSIVSGGGGSFVNAASPTTVFNGVAGTTYELQWTISNGVCISTSDNVLIQFDAQPTTAIAGPNQTLCATSTILAGNTPVLGTGLWTIVSGLGGSFVLDTNPTTTFNGVSGATYVLRWTTTNGVCSTQDDVQIHFYAIPDVAASDKTICSGSNASVSIANPNGVAGTTFSWTVFSSTNATGASAGNGSLISQVLSSANGTTAGTVVYRVTPSASGCPGTPIDVTVTVDPVPVITNSPASLIQSICSGTSLNFLPGSSIGSTTMTWTSSVTGTIAGISASGTGTITDTPVNTGNVAGTVTYQITPSIGSCAGLPVNFVVDVKPIPVATSPSPQGICSGGTTNIVILNPNSVSGTTYSWTLSGASNVTGASSGTGSVISQTLISADGISPGTIIYTITPNANGCDGSPISVTVNVTPKPVMTNTPTSFIQDICSATPLNFLPTSTVGSATFSWTSNVIGTLSGVSASGSGNITDTPVNATNTNAVIIYTITPEVAGCDGVPANLVVTVRPVPTATAGDQTICSGESTSIAILNPNSVVGTTYTWTAAATNANGAFDGSGSTISQLLTSANGATNGTVIYTITPSANGCPGPTYNVTATVKPVPVMSNLPASLSQQICSGETLGFIPAANIGGTTFTWSSTIVGTITAASVTGTGSGPITDTPVNIGNLSGTVTYRITPRFNGCNGLPVDLVVTVKPLPSATAPNAIICSGQMATININDDPKDVAGTTFAWTASSATVTGWANGNGSVIAQTLSSTSGGTVTYTITPTANACNGPTTISTVTVNPIATVATQPNFAVCQPITIPVYGTIGGSAGGATWSIVLGGGTISATTVSGTNVMATYTVAAGDIGGQVTLRLTTNDPDFGGPCSPVSDDLVIDVNRAPVVTVPGDYSICEPTSIGLIGTLGGSANSGVWSLITGTGTLSASSVTGLNVTASYIPSTTDVNTYVKFRLTSNDADGGGPCIAAFDEIEVHINEKAIVNAGVDIELCEDETVTLLGSINGAASSATWSGPSGTAPFLDVNDPTTTYTLTPADIASGGITLRLTTNNPGAPCSSVFDEVFVKINKLPEVILFGLQPAYAENNGVVTLDGYPLGGTFTGPGINFGTNQFDPANAPFGSVNITYTYTNPTTGCTNDTTRSTIVNPVTSVDFDIESQTVDINGNPQICSNSNFLELIGYPAASTGSPQTLFKSLDIPIIKVGFADYYVNTNGLAPGNYQIQYIYTNSVNATDTLTKVVIVLGAPKAIINFNRVCIADSLTYTDASTIPLNPSGATIVAYDWSYGEFGNGNDGVTRNPKYLYSDHGLKTVGLTVTTSQGCSHDTTRVIRVGPLPDVDFTWSKICSGLEVTEFLDATSTPGDFSLINEYQWNFDDGDILGFGPRDQNVPPGTHSNRTSGTYTNPNHDYNLFTTFNVQLTANTEDGCTGTISHDVIILDYVTPTASGGYSTDFEIGSNPWVVSTTSTNPSWIWDPPNGNVIQPSAPGNKAWWTGDNSDPIGTFSTFNNDERSEVLSPCLNLTDLKRPMISLDYWSDLRGAFDGAVVQYTTDDGFTWQTIGDANGYGINWYDTRDLTSSPGDQDNFAWSGTRPTNGWRNARFNLDQIPVNERDLVRFRVAFASNGDNPTGETLNGFAFDNIYIGEKNRNVLVEHFTNDNSSNASDQWLDARYDEQITAKDSSDFILVQYHIGTDPINADNPADPAARSILYGVSQAPTTFMDGIQGPYFDTNFNGLFANITPQEIDRRALEDPLFDIRIDTVASNNNTTIHPLITYTYIDSLKPLTTPVTLHAALIERGINGNGNVVRKLLLQSEGRTVNRTWDVNQSNPTEVADIPYALDVPVTNPDNLYIVAFVQDNSGPASATSRRILQSVIVKASRKVGPVITGIEDNPIIAELKGLNIYPNPASQIVKLNSDINFKRNYTWKLIDQRGVTVLSGDLKKDFSDGEQRIGVGHLANGIYIMVIQTGEKSAVHKKIAIMNRN